MTAEFLEIRNIPVADLVKFPGNARRGNIAEIRKSIKANGQYRSLIVRQCDDGLIILAGNHTYDALVAEGYKSARCEVLECSDHQARKINLADNRLSDIATEDTDALVELLSYLDEDYEGTGWSAADVQALITPPEPPDPSRDNEPGDDDAKHFAVVLLCASETDQAATCDYLRERGYQPVPARLGETVLRDAV